MTHQSPAYLAGRIVPPHVTQNLFCYLDARDWSGSGNWIDKTGQGRDWSPVNGPTKVGDYVAFNGQNQRFNAPSSSLYQFSGRRDTPMTHEFIYWLDEDQSGAITPGNNSLLGNTRGPGDVSFQLESIAAAVSPTRGIRQGGYDGAGGFPATSGTSVPSNRFNHMIMSCQPDGSAGFWLQGGVFYRRTWHTSNWTLGGYTHALKMGVANDSGGQGSVQGRIALHRSYDRKISEAEAWQNWLSVQPFLEELNG